MGHTISNGYRHILDCVQISDVDNRILQNCIMYQNASINSTIQCTVYRVWYTLLIQCSIQQVYDLDRKSFIILKHIASL